MKEKKKNISRTESTPTTTGPPTIAIDYDLYMHHLAESDLTDAQKKELLDTLWQIIVSFVDMGFGVHPLQQVEARNSSHNNVDSQDVENLIHQYSNPTNQLNAAALAKGGNAIEKNACLNAIDERR